MSSFESLRLSHQVMKSVGEMGFEETTPIQEMSIPLALKGRDIMGQAQTGTGKTAAYGIPLIEHIQRIPVIQGVVVAPTRELAVQVGVELNKIGKYKGIRALPIYGGQDINRQFAALKKKPQIIVGTPGRLLDHMRRKTVKLDEVKIVVLDEADEMLNMGFIEDIQTILLQVPEDRQTLLFSATIPAPISFLARRFMKDPELLVVKTKELTVPTTQQTYIEVPPQMKFDVLCRVLDIQTPEMAIVFARTKRRVDEVAEGLIGRGYSAEAIHGDLIQPKRDAVMKQFKEKTIDILVATDVAARGLDITGVTHVINFDVPLDPESYVHRIGRTGRAGNTGTAVTFITSREMYHLRTIERLTNHKIARKPLPTVDEAVEGQQRLAADKLLKAVDEGDYHKYKSMAESLLNETDSVTLLSAALKMLGRETNGMKVTLTEDSSWVPPAPKGSRTFPKRRDNHNRRRYEGNQKKSKKGKRY